MANVKITDLTALSGSDAVDADAFVVVDISADQTKKITRAELTTAISAANDYVTYTQLNANLNTTTANVTAVETRRTNNIAGAISTVLTGDLTASRAMVTNGSGKIAISDVTATELSYLDGVSSAVQTQIDAKIATTTSASNDYVTYTRLNANLNTTTSNVTAVETRRTNNIAGAISSVLTSDLTASRAMASDGSGKIAISDVTATELGYLDGVTSAIQTQFTGAETRRTNNIAGAVSTVTTSDLTADRAVISNGSGKLAISAVTSTEVGYLDGVSSAIQTQLDAKAALAGATFTGQVNFNDDAVITGNLTVNGDTVTANAVNLIVQDQFIALSNGGTSSMDVGIFYNRGTEGNAAVWYDASASSFYLSETKDPFSNTTVKPTSAANLNVGALTTSSITLGATAITATGTELNYVDGVTSAIQTQLDAKQATITGGATTIDTEDLTASRALVSSGSGKVAVSDVTATELGYLDGVTSAIQTQFTGAETRRTNNIAGAVSTVTTSDLTADRAVISNGSGKLAVSAVTSTEIGYLDGVTSSIQTQIDAAGATFTNAAYTTTTANSYNIGTTVANINETEVYLDGVYQIKSQYVMANSSHNVQFKEATFTAGISLEIVAHT
tara:strand:+ start:2302 stop:4155 length:1854 start_codon:yes stop_codon:yes gene_type:complete